VGKCFNLHREVSEWTDLKHLSVRSLSFLLVLVSVLATVQFGITSAGPAQPVQYTATNVQQSATTVCYQIQTNQFECDIYYPVTQTISQTLFESFTQTTTMIQTSTTLSTQTQTETSTYTQPLTFAQANWPWLLLIGCFVALAIGYALAQSTMLACMGWGEEKKEEKCTRLCSCRGGEGTCEGRKPKHIHCPQNHDCGHSGGQCNGTLPKGHTEPHQCVHGHIF
jgi:hypothetical protein